MASHIVARMGFLDNCASLMVRMESDGPQSSYGPYGITYGLCGVPYDDPVRLGLPVDRSALAFLIILAVSSQRSA